MMRVLAYVQRYFFLLIVLGYTLAGVLVSTHRYKQYDIFYYDFGIFDQAIWRISRFQAPIIDHMVVGGKWIFADHFSPGVLLLSPLYWFTDNQECILAAQAVCVGLSGLVLYLLAKQQTKQTFLSIAVLIMYYAFAGLQNAIVTDFHEMTVMTLPLMLLFWAMFSKKIRWYYVFLLLSLSFKESTFLLGIGISMMMFFINPIWKKHMLATLGISALWGYMAVKVIIPHFSGGFYQYNPTLRQTLFENILAFVDAPLKRRTLFYSSASFSFLPLLTPPTWPLIGQDILVRFVPVGTNTRWDLGLHYSAQMAVILAVSSVLALTYLQKKKIPAYVLNAIGIVCIVNALFLHQFVLHGALGLAYNNAFYSHSNDFGFLEEMVSKIPKDATVMTQNNIAPRFTHQKMWLLRQDYEGYAPDYILLDIREGQNANNFFGGGDPEEMLKKLRIDPHYTSIYSTEKQHIFKKIQ